jgi:hypothetical protein
MSLNPHIDQEFSDPSYTPLYLAKLAADPNGTQAVSAGWIKDRVREASFVDRFLPPITLSPGDPEITRSTEHDGLAVMCEIAPGGVAAMTMAMNATPDAILGSGKRFLVSFWSISTAKLEFDTVSLLAYRLPLTKIYEDNALKSLHEVKDRTFLIHAETAVEFMQTYGHDAAQAFNTSSILAGNASSFGKIKGENALARDEDDFVVTQLTAGDIVNLTNIFLQRLRRSDGADIRVGGLTPRLALCNIQDWNQLSRTTVEQVGSQKQGEIWVNGWSGDVFGGMTFVKSIKDDVIRRGNMYAFVAHDYLGKSFIWRDLQFWLERKPRAVSWFAWMDVGMCLSNVAGVVKLELYSGSVTSGEEDTGYENVQPLAESALGVGTNHKATEGGLTSYVSY